MNTEILGYIICAGTWIGIIVGWLFPMIQKRIVYEIYAAFALGIMLSMIVLKVMVWKKGDNLLLLYTGYALYVPALALAVSAIATLKRKGKPKSGWEHTTVFIQGGVFRMVRHPLYLGGALLSLGIALINQSTASAILGVLAVFCFWMASRKEDEFNLKKFGENYKEYMKKVPLWNLFKESRR